MKLYEQDNATYKDVKIFKTQYVCIRGYCIQDF